MALANSTTGFQSSSLEDEKKDNSKPTVAKSDRSAFLSFIKTLATFRGSDLNSLTAPTFLLSTTSIVEFPSYWAEHPSLWAKLSAGAGEETRARNVLAWFLASLKRQHGARVDPMTGRSGKPLNPFLGELFFGEWPTPAPAGGKSGGGVTRVAVEQVSHHPPVTAWFIWNDSLGIKLEGYAGQVGSFSRGSVRIKRYGHAVLTLPTTTTTTNNENEEVSRKDEGEGKKTEKHVLTLQSINIPLTDILRGAAPRAALDTGTPSYIISSSGYISTLLPGTTGSAAKKGSGGSWIPFRGGPARDAFTATLSRRTHRPVGEKSDGDEPLYTAEGEWTGQFELRRIVKSGSGKHGEEVVEETFDVNDEKALPAVQALVPPVEKQEPAESRRAWLEMTQAIRRGDGLGAGRAKAKLENEQREMRAAEAREGREWKRRFFRRVDGDDEVEGLLQMVGCSMMPDRDRGGIWRVDEEAVRAFVAEQGDR